MNIIFLYLIFKIEAPNLFLGVGGGLDELDYFVDCCFCIYIIFL